MESLLAWLVPLLVCPVCRQGLRYAPEAPGSSEGLLRHADGRCPEVYPVVGGVPRLLTGAPRVTFANAYRGWFRSSPERVALEVRWLAQAGDVATEHVVAGFDYEWAHFANVDTTDMREVFELYFDQVDPALLAPEACVLDAGCGSGRWAYHVASRGPRVIAVDLGASVDVARANTERTGRVACVQADLRDLPLRPECVTWAYSLGVLHHVHRPEQALKRIVEAVAPGGLVLLYLYYALENRGRAFRSLFGVVNLIRMCTSRLPRPAVLAFSAAVAILVYWPLARLSALLAQLGWSSLARALPLSFYAGRSLQVMSNDSLDRFGTRLERRYTREEMSFLMGRSGLADPRFSGRPPYWHAVGRRPPPRLSRDPR